MENEEACRNTATRVMALAGCIGAVFEFDSEAVELAETLARAASHAELSSLGISTGTCSAPLLHRAGADIVLSDLSALAQRLDGGAQELTQDVLLPLPLGYTP